MVTRTRFKVSYKYIASPVEFDSKTDDGKLVGVLLLQSV